MAELFSDFSKCRQGLLTEKSLKKAFGAKGAKFIVGYLKRIRLLFRGDAPRLEVINFESYMVVRCLLTSGTFGPFIGSSWKVPFRQAVDSALLKFMVFVPSNFDFVKGGKLPGLAGGTGNSGGKIPTGYDGWSVRFMFKEHGNLCTYLYYPDMKERFGEKRFLESDGDLLRLKRGAWNEIHLKVEMNSLGRNDGRVNCALNGAVGLELNTLEFRKDKHLMIDHFLFSCFMGGGDSSYAPNGDQYLLFKDFLITY
ncbi:MAG: polysaccharide lyase [Bacteroidales bacterium]